MPSLVMSDSSQSLVRVSEFVRDGFAMSRPSGGLQVLCYSTTDPAQVHLLYTIVQNEE
jgi:hypothetical protein